MCTPRLHNNLVGCIVSIYSIVPRLVSVAYLFACVNVRNNRTRTSLRIPFLGAFAKLPKTTICFVMSTHSSVRLSVRLEQLGSHWMNFHELRYLSVLENLSRKFGFD